MALTKQQQNVVDTVINNDGLVKTSAVAGSGKTHTLVELAKTLKPASGLYLAYNKAIADEASQKFKGTNIRCSTIHSMAYGAVVRQFSLKVGYFNARNVIADRATYKQKMEVVNGIENFCLSKHLSPEDFLDSKAGLRVPREMFWDNLNAMSDGSIECTHSFYLKLYHIYLADGTIERPKTDLLLVDEAGDLTELTIEIFKLIEAPKKVAVGDPMQNIYSFNNTVNAFKVLKNEGIEANLTKSFRVSAPIAAGVEAFVRKHVDGSFEFKGRDYEEFPLVQTKAYIARTNGGLLAEMFRLYEEGTPFHTTRRIDTMLELPLVLANLGNGVPIKDYKFKHIEKARKAWESSASIRNNYSSISAYVLKTLDNDEEMSRALKVLKKHGPYDLNSLAKFAREASQKPCNLTLSTAHSSKGLEFHEVEIAPDLNDAVDTALVDIMRAKLDKHTGIIDSLQEELRLYYVATTRAMVSLINAKHIKIKHS